MKKLLTILAMICLKTSIAQQLKPIINIYYDTVSQSNIIEYHSVPRYVLMDTIARRKGYKLTFHETDLTGEICGKSELDSSIDFLLFDLDIDANFDNRTDHVFDIQGKHITASRYAQYAIDTITSGKPPILEQYYSSSRRTIVLKFVNVPPTHIMKELSDYHRYTITYKLDAQPGQTATGLIPLDMNFEGFLVLFCRAHNITYYMQNGNRGIELSPNDNNEKKTL